jgi:uncharacterized OsmC-like protein/TusA-related sulfurtransferase
MDAPGSAPVPDAVCDGGDLDCGSGLLLIIRNAMAPLPAGGVLEVRSREVSVREDLPAWCRMVGHSLLELREGEAGYVLYFVRKKGADNALRTDLEQARSFFWQARVRWTEGVQAKVFARNHAFDIGQVASFDTADPAPSAVEYLLGAVGGALAVGFQWRLSQRGIAVRNLEISLKARSRNILVFLGVEPTSIGGADDSGGDASLGQIDARLYVDADAEADVLERVFQDTLRRCPVTGSLLRQVPVHIEVRTV